MAPTQNISPQRLINLQDKLIQLINSSNYCETIGRHHRKSQILKLSDNITLQKFLYVHDSTNSILAEVLDNKYKYINDIS